MSATIEKPVTGAKPGPIETTSETLFSSLVGINEAARLTRRSKGQISKDTTSGKLSHQLDERGNKRYMVAELERVYGLKTSDSNGLQDREKPEDEPPKTTAVEVLLLKQQLETLEQEVSSLREDKERLWKQNEQLMGRLLEAPRTPAEVTPPAEPPRPDQAPAPKSFWQRITGQ